MGSWPLDELSRLRIEVEALRDRVAQLEGIIGIGVDELGLLKRVIPDITVMESKILNMVRARGAVPRGVLYDALYAARPDCDQPGGKGIEVAMMRVRRKIAPLGLTITTYCGSGYVMAEADRKRLTSMMQVPQEVAA
ncbi:hypothetical protein [Bradyrhizobium sp. Tv2a-2]|uniref:hypothetical protein n=1 Tax=Bradyrhizobium sp. Tv2a-2 TaxID=113395 RepID=UPI0003FC861D|nr:hypothetical protein [Bradyrhizobium sp. Tv2a-2]